MYFILFSLYISGILAIGGLPWRYRDPLSEGRQLG